MCPVNRILCGARRLTSIIAHQIHPCCRNVSDQPARCRSRPLQTSDTPTPISDTPLGTHIRQSIQPQPSSPMQSSSMRRGAAFIVLGLLVNFAAARELHSAASGSHHAASLARNEINNRPIIGILSQPGEPAPKGMSYIAASYIKWVESAGARAVPIFYDMSVEEIRRRFSLVNGILLPGGGANLSPGHPFYDTARLLVDLAVEANENGDYFPVHGTCLGMETLAVILSGNYSILTPFDAENDPATLLYTDEAEDSHLLQSLPEVVVKDLQNSPITMENHGMGLSMASYAAENKLKDFFSVLSLSIDKSGNPYISTIEARQYPITATQWHPEKNSFEWHEELNIPHSPSAVRMSQAVANFFVSEARRNMHKARNAIEEDDVLIYNWKPSFTGKNTGHGGEERDFAQCYFFEGEPVRSASEAAGTSVL